MSKYLFPYKWFLKNGYPAKNIKKNNCNVFGTFICGGGSSMGYKLAGYNHLGGIEIDNKISEVYRQNHNPKYLYIEDLRKFNERKDLPKDLFDLDLLDGSPPCSSFSMAGNREKDWGKEKKFKEGQVRQSLDDLVYIYVETIKKLQPKIALLENVKGLIQGNARSYAKKMKMFFENAGYRVQVFLLNAATMGVPQKRERVFFVGLRKDFKLPKLKFYFNEKVIPFKYIENNTIGKPITGDMLKYWKLCSEGNSLSTVHPYGNYFGSIKVIGKKVCNTLIASGSSPLLHNKKPNFLSNNNICQIGSYPLDYDFKNISPKYLIGMSVPPIMIAQIANQIYIQWLSKIKGFKI